MRARQSCPDDDGAFAVRVLQQAYDMARLIDQMASSPGRDTTVRALSTAMVSLAQAVMSARVGDYEHEVVHAIAGHLERAAGALEWQASATARLACQDVDRAVGLLRRMSEINWNGEMQHAA